MATKKKLLQAAAGQAGGAALNVEDVFSTYLYDGSSSAQTITNGIDLSGEGGMVWIKERSTSGSDHGVHDTERGVKNPIFTNLTDAENSYYNTNNLGITAFNSNGFTVASGSNFNDSGDTAVSWTFRKAPKFFTVVTYTGDGTSNRQISHDLGGTVGHIAVKRTDTSAEFFNWHRTFSDNQLVAFTGTYAVGTYSNYLVTADSTTFTVGNNVDVNANGGTYVAYLWGHNNGDGEFGPDGDQDIIKCGSYTGDGTDGRVLDLGWEPQWFMVKSASASGNWRIVDSMRNLSYKDTAYLRANTSDSEGTGSYNSTGLYRPVPNGLELNPGYGNVSGVTYIYIAIRRGPMAVPESATDVFDIDTHDSTEPLYDTSFPVDFGMYRRPDLTQGMYLGSRMQGAKELRPNATSKEDNNPYHLWDYQNGWGATGAGSSGSYSWMWRRAPNFFDVVAYTGDGTAGRTISHNLGVAPEMMWVKRRDAARQWGVYHKDIGNTKAIYLNDTGTPVTTSTFWNDTTPTESLFTVGTNNTTNASGATYIAYLFATLDGVSKVGSYTGTGTSSLTVDCGFSSGARFVMIKRTDASGNWTIFDAERGIVAGADPFLYLNSSAAEITSGDRIDPNSTGFEFNNDGSYGDVNASGGSYIFYAIA